MPITGFLMHLIQRQQSQYNDSKVHGIRKLTITSNTKTHDQAISILDNTNHTLPSFFHSIAHIQLAILRWGLILREHGTYLIHVAIDIING